MSGMSGMSGMGDMRGIGGVLKFIRKYWAALLAVVLIAISAYHISGYATEQLNYESKRAMLEAQIDASERSIKENARYADIQDQLEPAIAEVTASRQELYDHFPRELLEEDQIMYVLYLETLFDTEIFFDFGIKDLLVKQIVPEVPVPAEKDGYLSDGSLHYGLTLAFNYETTYEGFKEMVNYLATDERITSVRYASFHYDAEKDVATGELTVLLYLLESEMLEYMDPDIAKSETGKENVFE